MISKARQFLKETPNLSAGKTSVILLLLSSICGVVACGNQEKPIKAPGGGDESIATTFSLTETDSGTWLSILKPWQGNEQPMHYFLYPKGDRIPNALDSITYIPVPIRRIVCYSTTQLPYLELLGVEDALVAFPSTQYISTPSIISRVENGQIRDLGQDNAINPEVLLDTEPDLVMMYAVNSPGDEYTSINRADIPVIFNADYLEANPLGKAEYIKIFGALFEKEEKADSIFTAVSTSFEQLTKLTTQDTLTRPTVFSGVVYGDTWFAPGADSWVAEYIKLAGGKYAFDNQPGSGSLQLSFESVYAQCLDADFWIGTGSFNSIHALTLADARYGDFAAVKSHQAYSYMKNQNPHGGAPYFERGVARPDLVLADYIAIIHPELVKDSLNFHYPLH